MLKNETLTNEGFALLIGVNDYSAYDVSMNQAPGTSDLEGSINDARSFWRMMRQLGTPAENLRILTSPKLDPRTLEGATDENVGEATGQAIRNHLQWLCKNLACEGWPAGQLFYSGHGDWREGEGLVLCPSDTTGPNLKNAVLLSDIQAVVAEYQVGRNLTLFLDTCHSGGGAQEGRVGQSLTGRVLAAALQGQPITVSDRTLAATWAGGVSYQANFSGIPHGAFSWAIGAVMDQWKAVQDGPTVRLDLSYGELLQRTQQVLDALSFGQAPVLHGPPHVAKLAVFQRGLMPDTTSATPDAPRVDKQLDPGTKNYTNFTLTCDSQTGVACADSTTTYTYSSGGSNYMFATNQEYWSIPHGSGQLLSKLQTTVSGTSLTIGGGGSKDWPASGAVPGFPDAGNLHTARLAKDATGWTKVSAPANLFSTVTSGTATAGTAVDFSQLSYNNDTHKWSGSIKWYAISKLAPTGSLISSSGTIDFAWCRTAAQADSSQGYSWWKYVGSVEGTTLFATG